MQKRGIHDGRRLAILLAFAAVVILVGLHSSNLKDEKTAKTCATIPLSVSGDLTSFLSTWNTTITSPGSSLDNQVKLPLESNGTYNFLVAWGDGQTDTITVWNQTQATHTYPASGIYSINITGICWGWRFNSSGDRSKLLEISQWGALRPGNSGGYFYGCGNMRLTAIDSPDLTGTTTLYRAFRGCTNLGSSGVMNGWNVSIVISMSDMFYAASSFNQDIGGWNVSRVMTMASMFNFASSFNQPIGNWNVSRVTRMDRMFYAASSFNQVIGGWDVSSVTDMTWMFTATSYNQYIGGWNVSSVTNMACMFYATSSFNQPIGGWDVSSVTDMMSMFDGDTTFNQPIGGWNVSSVTRMRTMFRSARTFNQPIGGWNVSSVTNMYGMFWDAIAFNQFIGGWDVSSVTDMGYMFDYAWIFNQPIGTWNVSSVTNMAFMFYNTPYFDQPIGGWDVSSVTNMNGMLENAWPFNQPIGGWDVSSVTNMARMFYGASAFNQPIGGWNVSSVTRMDYMFGGAYSFNQPIGGWNVSSVTRMDGMFYGATVFNQDIGGWEVLSVTRLDCMFGGAYSFNQDIGGWNVSKVTNMSKMFVYVASLSIEHYDALLLGWSHLSLQYGVSFHGGDTWYSNIGAEARNSIISTYNWIIIDAGPQPPPVITSPSDVIYTCGTIGHQISWIITDASTSITNYSIYCNGNGTNSGMWTSGSAITISIDGLAIGTFNFTIIVYDGYGGMRVDVVNVLVNAHPIITSPNDVTYTHGNTGHQISWTITDTSTGMTSYTVYRNGITIANGLWTSGVEVVNNAGGLAIGSYNFTIVAYDGLGGNVSDTVIVTVIESSAVPGYPVAGVAVCSVMGIAIAGITMRRRRHLV